MARNNYGNFDKHPETYGSLVQFVDYEKDGWMYHFQLREPVPISSGLHRPSETNPWFLIIGTRDGMEHRAKISSDNMIYETCEKIYERVSKLNWIQHGDLTRTDRTEIERN